MKVFENKYAQSVFDIIEPIIGKSMAVSTIKVQSKNIGSNEESLQRGDLQKLSEGIKKGLVIFIGTETAQKIASQIANL